MRLQIERLAYGGAGVSHLSDGRVAFVPATCPGDVVEAHVETEHPRYVHMHLVNVVEPSTSRVTPPCPYFGVCGGCQWQHVDEPTQLEAKRLVVADALERIGHHTSPPVDPCVASPSPYGYRNKIELSATRREGHPLELGFKGYCSDATIAIDECLLLPTHASRAPRSLRGALRYLAGREDLQVQRVGLRVSHHHKDVEVAIWTAPGPFPRRIAGTTITQATGASGVVRVMAKGEAAQRRIAGVEVLKGRGAWKERILKDSLLVSAPSFFQVNTAAAELLVGKVIELLDAGPDDRVADLYAGVGTFTHAIARTAGETIAVESYGPAVSDLRRNIEMNASPVEVEPGDVSRVLPDLGAIDLILVDPPRSGLSPNTIDPMCKTGARRIVYVSCDPSTLARDAARLSAGGYRLRLAVPVDLFPQTYHVETVAVFEASV